MLVKQVAKGRRENAGQMRTHHTTHHIAQCVLKKPHMCICMRCPFLPPPPFHHRLFSPPFRSFSVSVWHMCEGVYRQNSVQRKKEYVVCKLLFALSFICALQCAEDESSAKRRVQCHHLGAPCRRSDVKGERMFQFNATFSERLPRTRNKFYTRKL